MSEKKYSLEEVLSPNAKQELEQLKQNLINWQNEKKNHNYTQLKNISLTLEKIVELLEKQDSKQKELERKFDEVLM